MKPHIAQTLQDIKDQIVILRTLEAQLETIYGSLALSPVATPPAAKGGASVPASRGSSVASPHPRKHNYTLKPRAGRDTKLSVSDAVRGIVTGWAGEFTNKALREQILRRHPELKNKCACLASHLAYMIEMGELVRLGKQGREVTLKRGPKFAGPRPNPSAAGKALLEQIHQEEAAKLGGGAEN